MIGHRKRIRRGIMSVLRPLTGDRANGTALAQASPGQGSILVPKNSYLLPVPVSATGKGQIAPDMPLRTTAEITVLEAPTAIPVSSLLGGTRNNLANGTVLYWDPPLAGLTPTATLQGAMTGGANAANSPGAVKELLAFEAFRSADAALDIFNARISAHPALVLAWAGSRNGEHVGVDLRRRMDLWELYVIVETPQGVDERIDGALDILDIAEGYLGGRSSFDGNVFSAPPIEVTGTRFVRGNASSFLYSLAFNTFNTVQRIETRSLEDGDWALWLRQQLDLDTATPLPLAVVDQAQYLMGQDEFDSAFDSSFTTGE